MPRGIAPGGYQSTFSVQFLVGHFRGGVERQNDGCALRIDTSRAGARGPRRKLTEVIGSRTTPRSFRGPTTRRI